jgi:thiol-disulfide isomerase/thioredoxin
MLPAPAFAQQDGPAVVEFKDVQRLIKQRSDTTYILNFWASWCAPCLAEMPAFRKFMASQEGAPIRMVLISLDFEKHYDKQFRKAIQDNQLDFCQVVLLRSPGGYDWIDKVSPDWSGAIPGTLIYNPKKKFRKFYGEELNFEELNYIYKEIEKL